MNLAVQVGAVVLFLVLRLTVAGWLLVILVLSLLVLVVFVPPALAAVVRRRQVLRPAVAVPFLACALFLLVAGAMMPDLDDTTSSAPFWPRSGSGDGPPVPEVFGTIAWVAVCGYAVAVLWTVVAVIATGGAGVRPARAAGQPVTGVGGPPTGPGSDG